MDVFLKENDFKKAALTAHEVMLQEENKNQITLAACLVSCMKYIKYLYDNKLELDNSKQENEENNVKKVG
jgi:hypothetical protein